MNRLLCRKSEPYIVGLWLATLSLTLLAAGITPHALGESLFRASATHTQLQPMGPRSLFTSPRPQYVGDMVTILIDEQTQQQIQFDFRNEKEHTVDETGSTVLNGVVGVLVDKLPFGDSLKSNVTDILRVPSINGLDNNNTQTNRATVNRQNRIRDQITCQVVQVLPNGNLVVQGRKVSAMAKERTDMYVTGIVNPFYLDANNQIASNQVGNLQFMVGGQGIISRQLNDGLLSKVMQFLQ